MLKYLLFFPLLLGMLFQVGVAPTPAIAAPTENVIDAVYPGGMQALTTYLANNIVYPEEPKRQGQEAMVVIELTLGADGRVQNVKHLKNNKIPAPHPDMVAEASRVVLSMPTWEPALLNGTPVTSKTVLPIRFRLQ